MWQVTMTPEMWARVAAGIGVAGLISGEVFGKVHGQFTVILSRGEFDNWIVGATCGVKFVVFMCPGFDLQGGKSFLPGGGQQQFYCTA